MSYTSADWYRDHGHETIAANPDMPPEENDINNRIAELVGFRCYKFTKGSCDGIKITHCGSCGGTGHGNCYGWGNGPIQLGCCTIRPNYTQNIEEAWKLLDDFKGDLRLIERKDKWIVILGKGILTCQAVADTAPMAICKAILEVNRYK